ncbi:hypothetical protein R2601_04263 [Salipiger bermudensis HTCC2601]|uniref:Uncharacterized protein n=1 Tax=Salipiger bermudensis (strain DSM 26914 / JCM 13377 / KCTC 12554 / HTCC2601) TaxID=314265 RepID=Q0FVZ3_SALBH|nr:hypothetical protein R2601_04263 [Salipiger bermudensis HTCC2601]
MNTGYFAHRTGFSYLNHSLGRGAGAHDVLKSGIGV